MSSVFTSKENSAKNHLFIGLFVLLSFWFLFWLDHETKQISNLFTSGNLAALVIYFLPTYLVTAFCYVFLVRSGSKKPLIFSLILGIPMGIALIICAFLVFKN